jgi:hypothetical protein
MPAFNTHWLVGILSRQSTLEDIENGFSAYNAIVSEFKTALINRFHLIAAKSSKDEQIKAFSDFKKQGFGKVCDDFDNALKDDFVYDNITCFSAYMLGACGPDFWTVLSKSNWGIKPDTAGIHFDMGHYNRTAQQFKVAIRRWKDKASEDKDYVNSLQYKVEVSYFLGMATHIAADLIIHQLVNVYAGAYNLLVAENWKSEHGVISTLLKLWNTHNKVEHYWDSYVRYRYFGDSSFLWENVDSQNQLLNEPLGFPTTEKLVAHLNEMKSFECKEKLIDYLNTESNKLKIEKCFILPRIVCDRILASELQPFIYDVVANKDIGAFPRNIIFQDAIEEAEGYQMTNADGTRNEKKKLTYFSSAQNEDSNTLSYNYLNYFVCPNLARVRDFGPKVFYHLDALKPFVDSAVIVAKSFLSGLTRAIDKKDASNIGPLDHFWNLDTGLGLVVANPAGHLPYEVITQLNFVHITDFLKAARIKYGHYKPDLGCMANGQAINYTGNPAQKQFAFNTYPRKKPFKDYSAIEEEDSPEGVRYVEQIKMANPEFYKSALKFDRFFNIEKEKKPNRTVWQIVTGFFKEENKTQVRKIYHRLTLRIKAAIPHFTQDISKEKLVFYLYGDNAMKSVKHKEHMAKEWLEKSAAVQDCDISGEEHHLEDNLRRFQTHLLLNFENDKNIKREIEPGIWNNTINYQANKAHYSRNYAVGTGRANVLHPKNSGAFNGLTHFNYYSNPSPTEHVFFSIYLLARTSEGVFDMLSKEKVKETALKEIIKIDCLGFVKIVLFFTLDKIADGYAGSMLNECYIDGLRVPIAWA